MSNALLNHLEKTLVRTEARVAELQSMIAIAKQLKPTEDKRQDKLPGVK